MASESVVKIEDVLFTGFGSRSLLQTWFGMDGLFGTLEVSRDYLSIADWWSPKYEVRKELIKKLIFREHRMVKGLRFARLRVLGAPEYILFVTRSATDLKAALINAGYTLEPVH